MGRSVMLLLGKGISPGVSMLGHRVLFVPGLPLEACGFQKRLLPGQLWFVRVVVLVSGVVGVVGVVDPVGDSDELVLHPIVNRSLAPVRGVPVAEGSADVLVSSRLQHHIHIFQILVIIIIYPPTIHLLLAHLLTSLLSSPSPPFPDQITQNCIICCLSVITLIRMFSLILLVGAALLVLYFLYTRRRPATVITPHKQEQPKVKELFGKLVLAFASQTGTAAKMAELFAEEAQEEGFSTEVLDLKEAEQCHFTLQSIVLFFLSNTGEGDPPDNSVEFLKCLKNKGSKDIDFKNVKFSIFGLGNTQYQFFNKVAKDVYELLDKRGAKSIYKMGLGDNNASLEDDYSDWKTGLWTPLKETSRKISLQEPQVEASISQRKASEREIPAEQKQDNNLATWKLVLSTKDKEYLIGSPVEELELEFLTKNFLKSEPARITSVREVRQNNNDGSSVHVEIELGPNSTYKTAGNIGIYPQNDPSYVKRVTDRFGLDLNGLYEVKYEGDKRPKLNFVPPVKLHTLLHSYINLQNPITKSVLKHLAKLPSNDPAYFKSNSSPKTTEEYKRLSTTFHTLFDLVEKHNVDMTFETFVHLSDPIAPRLFTIASSSKVKKHVEIVDSIEDFGLCSKFFNNNPHQVRVEIRDSSFHGLDVMEMQKVIFVGAGTGFAPFRAFLQEKEHLGRGPLVSLFFGCKHEDGDFIYREEVNQWVKKGVINKFYPAFSRDQNYKIYVQTLLDENPEELRQIFAVQKGAVMICGSVSMGADVTKSILKSLEESLGPEQSQRPEKARVRLVELQHQKRIVKELW